MERQVLVLLAMVPTIVSPGIRQVNKPFALAEEELGLFLG